MAKLETIVALFALTVLSMVTWALWTRVTSMTADAEPSFEERWDVHQVPIKEVEEIK